MKIALIGYGKMGKMVEQTALRSGHTIKAIIDPHTSTRKISQDTLGNSDVCIDFSHPKHVVENIKTMADLGKNIVMGTTGWYDLLDEVEKIVKQANIGFIYSPNFSIGIALFLNIVKHAATLMNSFDEYDVSGLEIHHQQKVDNPSGTALTILDCLNKFISRKNEDIHFTGMRVGSFPGSHSVIFDSPDDTITLNHTARNRNGFANGAINAAEWIDGKKGFFTITDLLRSLYDKN